MPSTITGSFGNPLLAPGRASVTTVATSFLSRYKDRATFCSRKCKERASIASGKNYEYQRRARLKRQYGITVEDYDRMRAAQNGACAVCGTTTPVGRVSEWTQDYWLHVDHDHKTGTVRGLLCNECNTGLGKFQDDPELLVAAVSYLERG